VRRRPLSAQSGADGRPARRAARSRDCDALSSRLSPCARCTQGITVISYRCAKGAARRDDAQSARRARPRWW
jgi:hypothetical protein